MKRVNFHSLILFLCDTFCIVSDLANECRAAGKAGITWLQNLKNGEYRKRFKNMVHSAFFFFFLLYSVSHISQCFQFSTFLLKSEWITDKVCTMFEKFLVNSILAQHYNNGECDNYREQRSLCA